jgi:hypothetical protein
MVAGADDDNGLTNVNCDPCKILQKVTVTGHCLLSFAKLHDQTSPSVKFRQTSLPNFTVGEVLQNVTAKLQCQ